MYVFNIYVQKYFIDVVLLIVFIPLYKGVVFSIFWRSQSRQQISRSYSDGRQNKKVIRHQAYCGFRHYEFNTLGER